MIEKGKNTNSLMRHIRSEHKIKIWGSSDKKELLKMGYFHGYKAYRFNKDEQHKFSLDNFQEIKYIYQFDNELKSLFYSPIMQLETMLKNYTISVIVSEGPTDFESIYKNQLTRYNEVDENKSPQKNKKDAKKRLKSRLELKGKFDDAIARNYGDEKVHHYLSNGKSLPIWAIFELISFGEFGTFLLCLNTKTRLEIQEKIGTCDKAADTKGALLPNHVFTLKDLRNAVAHNHIVFDCRFRDNDVGKNLKSQLEKNTGVQNITFDSIIDYLVLIIYYQSSLKITKTEMSSLVRKFNALVKQLQDHVSQSVFDSILGSDIFVKIDQLNKFI